MKKRLAVLTALGALAVTAVAAPAASASKPSMLDVVAASANNNEPGQATDRYWYDFDVLREAAVALGLAPALDDGGPFDGGTVLAPNDRAFQVLVSDITNTPLWKLSEADVLNTLVAVAGESDLNGTGVSGATALTETVKYHITTEGIANMRKRAFGPNLTMVNDTLGGVLTNEINPYYIPFVRWVGLGDGDKNDKNPIWYGRTVHASNGTIQVISGVLRPLDLDILFPADD